MGFVCIYDVGSQVIDSFGFLVSLGSVVRLVNCRG